MKKILVIGSTVVDVIINLEEYLPKTGQDVHIRSQQMSLGGCAYNVSDSIRHFQVPYVLFSPVGTGAYGDFVRNALAQKGISSPIPTPSMDNGCCYCFIEKTGERTFISYHGAEYLFEKEWFSLLDPNEFDSVYICGLEIEERTGNNIIEFLEKNPRLTVFFAPGPRLTVIEPERIRRLFALSPVLHVNETEAMEASGKSTFTEAAEALFALTHNTVIITLGKEGCYYYDGKTGELIPPCPANQVDTIGAGDSHIGSVIACLKRGDSLTEAIRKANRVSAEVVGTTGALLPDDVFHSLEF